MHIHTRNVNTAFQTFVSMFHTGEYQSEDGAWGRLAGGKIPLVKKPSRNGSVMMIDEPVTITYSHPRERVLFNAARDANPFFHLYESLWMLAGRNDVASVAYYAKQMKEYSDDGETLNGAYGYRWRQMEWNRPQMEHFDQLGWLVQHLKGDPASRRAVLQMWTVEHDLLDIGIKGDERFREQKASKDVCCNLSVMFSIRSHESDEPNLGKSKTNYYQYLDMTVTNRSNDMVWGMLGANYVHFTFLQEYMAARLGVEVGKYHHFTNNLHVYDWNWKPEEWLTDERPKYEYVDHGVTTNGIIDTMNRPRFVSLIKDPAVFEKELPLLVSWFGQGDDCPRVKPVMEWQEPFFRDVADHALNAHRLYKYGLMPDALAETNMIKADDWRIACTNWLTRRIK